MKLHGCIPLDAKAGPWGSAITTCWEHEDGTLWVSNDEYSSTVNFCPYCGYKSKVQWEKLTSETSS